MKLFWVLCSVAAMVVSGLSAAAQAPAVVNYQGRLQVQGTNCTGTGYFKFAIGAENMGTVYWSNDGTLAGEPAVAVPGNLDKGLYNVGLGDTTLPGMDALDPAVFANTGLWLRVWFSDGVLGFEQLIPDKPLASVPYALVAGSVAGLSGFSVTDLDDVTDAGSGMIITDAERSQIATNAFNITALDVRLEQVESNLVATGDVLTHKVSKTGDTMTGPLVLNNASSDGGILITSTGASLSVGTDADGRGHGVAVGRYANGSGYGTALGYEANAASGGLALGASAHAPNEGIALGQSSSADGTERISIGNRMTNAVDNSAAVRGTLYLDGGTAVYYRATAGSGAWMELLNGVATGSPLYAESDPVWSAEKSAYATGTPLYAYSESDPVWSAEKSAYATGTPLYVENDPLSVKKTGDTMTGPLVLNNAATSGGIFINSTGTTIAIGTGANGSGHGLASGRYANGSGYGAAHGYYADGSDMGAAQGYSVKADWYGAAVGAFANGTTYGAALGYDANAAFGGLALGTSAHAPNEGIALGQLASADGTNRISMGNRITNAVDNSAAIRGTLYLDGGSSVYYRATAGSGAWTDIRSGLATGTPLYAFSEADPVYSSEKSQYATGTPLYAESDPSAVLADGARAMTGNLDMGNHSITNVATNSIVFADGTAMGVVDVQNWTASYNWGDHSSAGYATGTPVYAEADPVWAGASNLYYTRVEADNLFVTGTTAFVETDPLSVKLTGDTMTGPLNINADGGVLNSNAILDIQSPVSGDGKGLLIPRITAAQRTTASAAVIGGLLDDSGALRGGAAQGLMVYQTDGQQGFYYNTSGTTLPVWVKVGDFLSNGSIPMTGQLNMNGNPLTNVSSMAFDDRNVQVGNGALSYATAAGGVAIGRSATANYRTAGVAIGAEADGDYNGIGIGYQADGQYTNIAIGYKASTYSGYDRIAIGYCVTNRRNDSCAIRGTLYLDGGTGVMVRSSFGTGGWSLKAFTIDHPRDPENMVLRHFCMEGPEVLNVYSGNAVLDDAGEAVISLPDYYDALNKDPRYSLTPVGTKMDLFVKQEISGNQFVVAGGVPGGKFSWEIKALRSDPAALEDLRHRPVEQLKRELTPDQMVRENETINTFP